MYIHTLYSYYMYLYTYTYTCIYIYIYIHKGPVARLHGHPLPGGRGGSADLHHELLGHEATYYFVFMAVTTCYV